MLIDFFYQWNPFNIYGLKVGPEELLVAPLLPNETLMEDNNGHCRRIKVPTLQSPLREKFVFWLQTHLNKKGHLEAIDKIITLFYQKIFQHPPKETKKLQEIHLQIDQLRSLKNDYNFIHLKHGNPAFIDSRLKEIERHAYAIFSYYYKQYLTEQEQVRKLNFLLFDNKVKQQIQNLKVECIIGLIKARFLMIVPSNMIYFIFKERIKSLDRRLLVIQDLFEQIDEMEKLHNEKFLITYLHRQLNQMKTQLNTELRKIDLELEILIRSLIFHYHLAPFKEEVIMLLDFIKIDPHEFKKKQSNAYLFQDALATEIKRIKSLFANEE